MTNNGIVLPNLEFKPVALEIKEAYAPIRIEIEKLPSPWHTDNDDPVFMLRNDSLNLNTEDYVVEILLKENGMTVYKKLQDLPCVKPSHTAILNTKIDYTRNNNCEYYIDFIISNKNKLWYQEDNDFISHSQYFLGGAYIPNFTKDNSGEFKIIDEESYLKVFINNTCCVISKIDGSFGLNRENVDYILPSSKPCFTRPITGIDCREDWGWHKQFNKFKNANITTKLSMLLKDKNTAIISFDLLHKNDDEILSWGTIKYTINSLGLINIEYCTQVYSSYVSRVGLEFVVADGFEEFSYYGRGENENYKDRLLSAPVGVYNSNVEGEHFPFIPPSENGGHEDTRWISFANKNQQLTFSCISKFHFDVHHSKIEDYNVKHDYQILKRNESYLHIDCAHEQIGSEMSWSTQINKSMLIGRNNHYLSLNIIVK